FMRDGELFQELQIKTRFLSVVSGVIKALSLYHGLNKKGLTLMSTRERCQQLVFEGIIDKNLGVYLEMAYDFSNRFRALSHCDYDNEYDYWLLFGDNPRVISKRLWQHYPQIWKETIVMLHEVIYPLHNAFADWMDEAQFSFLPLRRFALAPEIIDRFQSTLSNEGKNIAYRFSDVVAEILQGDKIRRGTFLPRLSQCWWQFLLVTLLHLLPKERANLWLKILPQFSLLEREQFLEAWDILMQQPLNLEQEHGYFSKAEIRSLREGIAAEFVSVAPHVIFEDGWTILAYRKQKQWQQAVKGLFSGPFSLDTNDLADTVVHKKQVVVGCLDPKLSAKGLRKRVQRGQAISSLFVLTPEVQAALERDERRAFREAEENPAGKRHIVLFFENKVNSETYHFCLKLFPENPGMEYFITQLQYTLGGDELPDVWLWRIYTAFYPDGIAALLMEDVRGLRYTPEDKVLMLNLSQIREKNPGILFAIDEDSFTRHFLRVTLTTPEDDKPNDYYVIPGNRKDAALRGRYILHRVDNERSLYVSELFEHKTSLLGQGGYNPDKVDRVLKLKTVIYCMENMGVPLSAMVLGKFVQLDIKQVFKRWLEQIKIWNVAAREVFKPIGVMPTISRSSSSSAILRDEESFRVARMHYQGNFYRHGVFHFAPNHLHAKELENFCLTVMPVPINKFMEVYLLLQQMKLFFEKGIKIASMPTGLETLKAIRPDQYKHYHENLNPAIRIGIKETDIRRLSEGVFRRFDQATEGGYNRSGESSQVYRSMVTSALGELMRAEDYDAVLQGSLSGKETKTADTVESLVFNLEKYELSESWTDEVQMIQRILLDRFWDILSAPIIEPNSRFSFFMADDPVRKRLDQILTEFSNLSYHNKLELRRYFLGGRKKKAKKNVAAFHPEVKKYVLSLLLNEPIQIQDPPLRRLDISGLKEIITERDLLKLLQKQGKTLEKVIIATQFNPYGVRGFKECLANCSNLIYVELSITEAKISSRISLSLEYHSSQLQTLILSGFVNLESLIIMAPKLMHLTLRGLLNLKSMDITLEKLQFIDICHCPRLYSHVFQDAIMGRLGLDQKMPVIQLKHMSIKKSFLMRLVDEMLWREPDMSSKITLVSQFTLRQWRGLELVFNQECSAKEYKVCLNVILDKDPDLKQLYSNSRYRGNFAKVLIMTIQFLAKAYPALELVAIELRGESIVAFKTALKQVRDPEISLRILYNDTPLYGPMARETDFIWHKKRTYHF
ncbi:MAG: hypothetical protein K2Q33_00100, partial [Gammaproteobacteria bacterium]|nr:hypothetical protein [Gammaproteobacteria bacterium]